MKKIYILWFLGALGVTISGIVNAGTGTFYDASNFGSSGSGGGGGTGDVVGPASSTDNAVCRYDGVTGKLLQDSLVSIDDTGTVTIPAAQSIVSSTTGSSLTIVGSTAADATRPSIVLSDTTPSIASRANTYTWHNGSGATQYATLTATTLTTADPVVAIFGGAGGSTSTRIGQDSLATTASVAIGYQANAGSAQNAVSIGFLSSVGGGSTGAVALGVSSTATGGSAISIGDGSIGNGTSAIALGNLADTHGNTQAIAIGTSADVTSSGGVSIGTNATADNDDVAVGSLASCTGPGGTPSVCIGRQAAASNFGISIGFATSSTLQSVSIGRQANSAVDSVAIGTSANTALNIDSVAIGNSCDVSGDNAVCMGPNSEAALDSVSIGNTANASSNSISIGFSSVTGSFGTALGYDTNANTSAVAIGHLAQAAQDGVGIGHSASCSHTNSVCIGEDSTSSATSQFQVGASGNALNMRSYGNFQLTNGLGIWNTTPPGAQPAAIPDAAGGLVVDIQCRAALNSLLAAARGMGMIAP